MANGGNKNLGIAKEDKNDEFYTQLSDIEKELRHYKDYFKNKIVFCNCDDPYESNFFKYFAMNFNSLGLKKLITTCYAGSPIVTEQLSLFDVKGLVIKEGYEKHPYKIEITEVPDSNKDGAIDLSDVEYLLKNNKNTLTLLKGDGDFRSDECVELLKESDIVVTNPPFSLFREYIAQLVEYNKDFLIIGNQNALTYREVFPYVMDNRMWLGYNSGGQTFLVPNSFSKNNAFIGEDGKKYAKFGNICWYTNLDISIRHEKLILYKKYDSLEYPKYVNYNAINVDKVSDIPCDYNKAMGVPITFIDKYNPNQFKILGIDGGDMGVSYGISSNLSKEECDALFHEHKGFRKGKLCYRDKDGKLNVCYRRVLIEPIEEDNDGNKVA